MTVPDTKRVRTELPELLQTKPTLNQQPSKTVPSPNTSNLDIIHGDHGIEKNYDLNDFLLSKENEPHTRRSQLIKSHPQISKLMGHEPKTKYIVFSLVSLQIAISIITKDWPLLSFKYWFVVYVFGATITQALFLAVHEICHNLAFKSIAANRALGFVANLPIMFPFSISFKEYHMDHHRFQGNHEMDTDIPTKAEAYLFNSIPGKLFFMFNQTWFYALRPVLVKPKAPGLWHLVNALIQVVFVSTIYTLYGYRPLLYFFFAMHFAGSLHPMASHFIAEHYTFVGHVETASYYGPLNMLAWNVGYHQEHHDFPNVAWSNLPRLKDLVPMYETLPYHVSWPKVMWEFLFNPSISMYNRVVRDKDEKVE
jgi:sphingolipid delta-4 desaturase